MKKIFAVLVLLGLSLNVQADVFHLGAGYTNLETVTVGDAGNIGELSGESAGGYNYDQICGSVGYNYKIGKYEVTAAQYTDFLNAKAKIDNYDLYNKDMADITDCSYPGCNIQRSGTSGNYCYTVADDWANRPVNYISYWDSCRFVNWLGNGQGDGDTETGAYDLNGYNGEDGRTIQRNVGWKWAIPSEDEWYKAAYYKGGGTNAGYWDYPTQSNTKPANQVLSTDLGNSANYYIDNHSIGFPYWRTIVGEFENSASAYGTYDQAGNVWEWNETIISDAYRGFRGGSFANWDDSTLQASYRNFEPPNNDYYNLSYVGFRVVQAVPEPSSIIALLGGLTGILGSIACRKTR